MRLMQQQLPILNSVGTFQEKIYMHLPLLEYKKYSTKLPSAVHFCPKA